MKAAREQRVKGRAAAKERTKERIKERRNLKSDKVHATGGVMGLYVRCDSE
jgi:hypothetical protein